MPVKRRGGQEGVKRGGVKRGEGGVEMQEPSISQASGGPLDEQAEPSGGAVHMRSMDTYKRKGTGTYVHRREQPELRVTWHRLGVSALCERH